MDITSIGKEYSASEIFGESLKTKDASVDRNASFDTLFQSALSMVNETNDLTNAVKEEQMKYAMGYSENEHDLLVAQTKASMSLQYTVAVRNKLIDAYKEIMNLQF